MDGVSAISQRPVAISMANTVNVTMSTVKNLTIHCVQVICVERLIFKCFTVSFFVQILNHLCVMFSLFTGHGACKCGKCECKDGYEGTACHCEKSDEACKRDGNVCFKRGKCVCNQCECERGYKGPYCETCSTCQRPCQQSG